MKSGAPNPKSFHDPEGSWTFWSFVSFLKPCFLALGITSQVSASYQQLNFWGICVSVHNWAPLVGKLQPYLHGCVGHLPWEASSQEEFVFSCLPSNITVVFQAGQIPNSVNQKPYSNCSYSIKSKQAWLSCAEIVPILQLDIVRSVCSVAWANMHKISQVDTCTLWVILSIKRHCIFRLPDWFPGSGLEVYQLEWGCTRHTAVDSQCVFFLVFALETFEWAMGSWPLKRMGYDLIYTALTSGLNPKKLLDCRTCGQCGWSRFMLEYSIWKSDLFYLRVIKWWVLALISWGYLSSLNFFKNNVCALSYA